MDVVKVILIILHFVGLASLLGGFMTQMKDIAAGRGRVVPAMVHGALTQLVTGLLLVGLAEMGDGDVNHMKVGIKLLIAIVITVLVFVGKKKDPAPKPLLLSIGVLTLINVVVAVAVQ